jgi:hypothetical protein
MTGCIFTGNTVSGGGNGGGIKFDDGVSTVTNCIFDGNHAEAGGGVSNTGLLKIIDCTFTGNTGHLGGGLSTENAPLIMTNCILWDDHATYYGPEIFNDTGNEAITRLNHCDIQGSGGSAYWYSCLGTDGGGNIDGNPQFVNAANPAGPDCLWRTSNDGLALSGNSPCINAGTAYGAPLTDILGNPRVGAPDIGAYEYQLIPKAGAAGWIFYR